MTLFRRIILGKDGSCIRVDERDSAAAYKGELKVGDLRTAQLGRELAVSPPQRRRSRPH